MDPIITSREFSSQIDASKLFKLLFLEGDKNIPKLIPRDIKSIDVLEGEGGPGSVKLVNFAEGSELCRDIRCLKLIVNRLDKEKMIYKYTILEGVELSDRIGSISCEINMGASPSGGCKGTIMIMFHPKRGVVVNREEITAVKEKAISLAISEAIEASVSVNAQVILSRPESGGGSSKTISGNKSEGTNNIANNFQIDGNNNMNFIKNADGKARNSEGY